MIHLQEITLNLGTKSIFDQLSATIPHNKHIGLVGRNGVGKSTLLRAITKNQELDKGKIFLDSSKTLAYMPQETTLLSDKTVFEETLNAFSDLTSLEQELKNFETLLSSENDCIAIDYDRYAYVQQQLQIIDKVSAHQEAKKVLLGLGFKEETFQKPVSELSLGWRMRIALAKLLLQKSDFYLFDEPTNHLDISSKGWFLNYLQGMSAGFLLVTHDRYFLDRACEEILEIEHGKANFFKGNYSEYLTYKDQQRALKEEAYARQQKEIAAKQAVIDRFRAKASKATMAQSKMKALNKIERISCDPVISSVSFTFPEAKVSGQKVLSVENLAHSFEQKKVFSAVSLELMRGSKAALIAPNGTGKTTLLNLIIGKHALQQGQIEFGHNVNHAVFEQDQALIMQEKNTILEEVTEHVPPMPEQIIRGFLGSFLFTGDDIYKKIGVLSGGERNRVAMTIVLLQKANFLLLDEPTNHLDLHSKEVLINALKQFEGTVLFVSHDQDFISEVADHIFELSSTGLSSFPGNYEEYLWSISQKESKKKVAPVAKAISAPLVEIKPVSSNKEQFLFRKEIQQVENRIAKLEKELAECNVLLEAEEYGSAQYEKMYQKLLATENLLNKELDAWEKLSEKLL